jgi:hypothetical protein
VKFSKSWQHYKSVDPQTLSGPWLPVAAIIPSIAKL